MMKPQGKDNAPNFALNQVEAVFFDLDDTLCAYWDASKAALHVTFQELAPDKHTPEEWIRNWAAAFREFGPTLKQSLMYDVYLKTGTPTRNEQMLRTIMRAGIDDTELAKKLGDRYALERNKSLRLFDDAIEVLNVLHRKYPLGLITNGPADVQREEVSTLGLERWFDHILIEGEMGLGKPNEKVFRHAESLVGKQPDQILMIGNSYSHDVQPALKYGWHGIWVRRPSDVPPTAESQEALPEQMPADGQAPTAIVSDLVSILPILGIELNSGS